MGDEIEVEGGLSDPMRAGDYYREKSLESMEMPLRLANAYFLAEKSAEAYSAELQTLEETLQTGKAHEETLEKYLSSLILCGVLSARLNKFQDVKLALEEAGRYADRETNAFLGVLDSYVLFEEGEVENSIQKFEEVKKLDPGNAAYNLSFMGNLHFERHNYSESKKYLNRALLLEPKNNEDRVRLELLEEMRKPTRENLNIKVDIFDTIIPNSRIDTENNYIVEKTDFEVDNKFVFYEMN